MSNRKEISSAFLVNDEWLIIHSGNDCFLIHAKTGKTFKQFNERYIGVFNGVLSPDKKKIALGSIGTSAFIWHLELDEVLSLGASTTSARALGWLGDKTVVFSAIYGGVVTVDIEEFKKNHSEIEDRYPNASGHYGIKYYDGEVFEDDMLMEVQLDFRASDFFSYNKDNRVIELLEGEQLNVYTLKNKTKIDPTEIDFEMEGYYLHYPRVLVCNQNLIVVNKKKLDILDIDTGKRLNVWDLEKEDVYTFNNIEKTNLYTYNKTNLEKWDLKSGNRYHIWTGRGAKDFSITKNLLLIHSRDNYIELIDLNSKKSLLKIAVFPKESDLKPRII
ncbi:hypothetical protein ACOKFD_10895 [Flagellimonas sp. S174]|uniref:hypothetical protein n=1 Tax=Flagellimonas sp. S174 TaxID=3410790 RepID=UPI003BF55C6E